MTLIAPKTYTLALSLEISTPKTLMARQQLIQQLLAIKTIPLRFISLTLGAGGTIESVENVLSFIQDLQTTLQLPVVPHVTGTGQTEASLLALLKRLMNMQVTTVLAVRGDVVGPTFLHGNDLVQFIKQHSDLNVWVAGYPEGHPEDSDLNETINTLNRKQKAGASAMMTQVVMNNQTLFDFQDQLFQRGVTLPIITGVMPYVNQTQVRQMQALTGATQSSALWQLLQIDDTNMFYQQGLALTIMQIKALCAHGFNNVHLFSFNQPQLVQTIWQALQ